MKTRYVFTANIQTDRGHGVALSTATNALREQGFIVQDAKLEVAKDSTK